VKVKNWHVIAVISCVLWLAYYPALSSPLNSVDDARLAHDLLNRSSFSWQDFWFPRSKSYFRPLVNSSFILDQLLWGFEEPFLHLENLLLHWINTLLVYSVARKVAGVLQFDSLVVPAVAAVLFGLHPINSEAVIWIAGRADLLATTFILLALLGAIQYLVSGRRGLIVMVFLACLAGALAKETALLVLPGLLLVGCMACKDKGRFPVVSSRFRAYFPAFAAGLSLAAYAVLRHQAMQGGDLGVRHVVKVVTAAEVPAKAVQQVAAASVPYLETVQTVLKGAGFYGWKLLQPFPLSFGIIEVPDGFIWLGCLLVTLAVFLVWRLSWSGSFLLLAMLFTSVALLVALGNITWTPYAERYMYAPSAMLALSVSLGVGMLASRRRLAWHPWLTGLFGTVMLLSGWAISQRALVWQDNVTLFADTVEKSPGFAMAQNELAQALWKQGRQDEALEILGRVEMPETQMAFLNKALVLVNEGKLAEARKFLLDNLPRKETQAYHRIILERLITVVELQRKSAPSTAQALLYDDEISGYLQQLWRRTGEPFYLYRLGQKQMETGDLSRARESFALAYRKFPPGSIYKDPSRKLAERLTGQ